LRLIGQILRRIPQQFDIYHRTALLHWKAPHVAIHAPPRTRVRFAITLLSAACAFVALAHAEPAAPDRVSLSESTITWSTVKYATNADNGFV
jgi:hypothetical protein